MRTVISDGFQNKAIVKYDNDSVFNNGIVLPAGGTLETTDPILLIPSGAPTLRVYWTTGPAESADFEIRLRLFETPCDVAGPFAVIQVVFGLTAIGAAGINGGAFSLRENAMIQEIIYGHCDVQIINNDPVNPLQGVYGEILMERSRM